jgi:hypothetical protein
LFDLSRRHRLPRSFAMQLYLSRKLRRYAHTLRDSIITVRAKFHTRSRTGSCWFGLQAAERQTKKTGKTFRGRHRSSWKISSPSCDGFARACQCYEVSSHFFFCYGSVLIAPQQCVARVCTFWWKRRTKSERRRAAQVRWAAIELGNFYYFMFARTIISELTAEGWVFLFSLSKISLSASKSTFWAIYPCSHFAFV